MNALELSGSTADLLLEDIFSGEGDIDRDLHVWRGIVSRLLHQQHPHPPARLGAVRLRRPLGPGSNRQWWECLEDASDQSAKKIVAYIYERDSDLELDTAEQRRAFRQNLSQIINSEVSKYIGD